MSPFIVELIAYILTGAFGLFIFGFVAYFLWVYNKRLVIIDMTGHVDVRKVKRFDAKHRIRVNRGKRENGGDITDTIIPITHPHIFPSRKAFSAVREWVFWKEGDIAPISKMPQDADREYKTMALMGLIVGSEDDPTLQGMVQKPKNNWLILIGMGVGILLGVIIAAAAGHMTL